MSSAAADTHEITRFQFGRNWRRFLSLVDEDRILDAEHSLKEMLGLDTLAGRTFLDVGSGSGLFSLAAMRLGAARVYSIDSDRQSVACTQELRRRYSAGSAEWTIECGSILDSHCTQILGTYDVVYSWGVLHHTGAMWEALNNAASLVAERGLLYISIYNDQGWRSICWRRVKILYNKGFITRYLILGVFLPFLALGGLVTDSLRGKDVLSRYRNYGRGMSAFYDWIDWLGGYPFEVSKPEEIIDFCLKKGFQLRRLKTCGGKLGCNEFVFVKR